MGCWRVLAANDATSTVAFTGNSFEDNYKDIKSSSLSSNPTHSLLNMLPSSTNSVFL